MGAVVLCAALRCNASEGHTGQYFGTDIYPHAFYLLKGEYAKFGTPLVWRVSKSLETLEKIDLFINDSDHRGSYEQAEYDMIRNRLTPRAIVLGDTSNVTTKLAEFSMRYGRRFVFLSEEPADHWYKGGGIGISTPGIANSGS